MTTAEAVLTAAMRREAVDDLTATEKQKISNAARAARNAPMWGDIVR